MSFLLLVKTICTLFWTLLCTSMCHLTGQLIRLTTPTPMYCLILLLDLQIQPVIIWMNSGWGQLKKMCDKRVRYDYKLPCWLCCAALKMHRIFFVCFNAGVLLRLLTAERHLDKNAAIVILFCVSAAVCASKLFVQPQKFQGCLRLIKLFLFGTFFFFHIL